MKRFITVALIAACFSFAVPLATLAVEAPAQVASVSGAIDINTATVKELQSLPGIGKVTAERITAYRTQNGPFTAIDDLLKVKGIGKKSLDKIRERVAVN